MATIQAVTVPKWGLTMEEGTVTSWLVEEGQQIQVGDEIMEMETSKIVNVVEAIVAGTLRRRVAQEGETLPIAGLLGVVADDSASDEDIDAFIAGFAPAEIASTNLAGSSGAAEAEPEPAAPEPAIAAPPEAEAPAPQQSAEPGSATGLVVPPSLCQGDDDSALFATVHARKFARDQGINLHQVKGSGRDARISRRDIEDAIVAAGGSVPEAQASDRLTEPVRTTVDDSAIAATSVARRLATELGINLHECRVTGSRGRVCKADVEAANARLNIAPAAATEPQHSEPLPVPSARVEEIPMSGMRRTIAGRLQASKQTAPHFRLVADCEVDGLLELRRQINEANPAVKISLNDFVVKACAVALTKVPDVNVQFDEASQTIRRFADADIAVAVAIEDGLITPIVSGANNKTLSAISGEVRDLSTRAKAGTLSPDQFQGGTFTISNLGMYGIRQFDAIINPPQAAILAVGAAEQRMVVRDGGPAVVPVMTLSLSADHRVIDGAVGAQFMQALKHLMQNPALMLA